MEFQRLPFDAPVDRYAEQAAQLLDGHRAGDPDALRLFHHHHPRFLDSDVQWLARPEITADDIRAASLDSADAQLALARWYDFPDWPSLARFTSSLDLHFESAVEAIVHGELPALEALLRVEPRLVHARSNRAHAATLVHYLAANGVEGYRQESPPNAVDIAAALLRAGAEPDALAHMYGGECATMSMLVSSSPPSAAGVQVPLVHALVDFGASVEPRGSGDWTSPLITALVFGFTDAAEALVSRGAKVDNLATAAGLGRADDVVRLLPNADPEIRHRAFALAAQLGQVDVVRLLLDAGEDPDRYNPRGTHSHSTPLHQAVWAGQGEVVRLLVERGARLDLRDTTYQGTPLGWAEYGKKDAIAVYLRSANAPR